MRTDIPIKKLIHTYVSNIFKLNSNDTNGIEQSELSQVQQCTEKAIYDSVREEILKDLTESEKLSKLTVRLTRKRSNTSLRYSVKVVCWPLSLDSLSIKSLIGLLFGYARKVIRW